MEVAIFDIDNTLIKGSTTFLAANALSLAGLVDLRKIPYALYQELQFRLTKTEPNTDRLKEKILRSIDGVELKKIEKVFEMTSNAVLLRINKKVLEMVNYHKIEGREVWLATAGPLFIAQRLVDKLGLDQAFGTDVRVKNGRCTSELIDGLNHGERKAANIKRKLTELNITDEGVYAYSDSKNDIPLLELAKHSTVVNPNKELHKIAKNRGWDILRA